MPTEMMDLLRKPMNEIERPKLLPAGTYYGIIKSHELGKSTQKKTPFVRFHVALTGAGEDVDQELLEGIELAKKILRRDFFLTEDALFRVKDFLASLGIEVEGRSLGECIPEAIGQSVMLTVRHRPIEGRDEPMAEVSDMVGAE